LGCFFVRGWGIFVGEWPLFLFVNGTLIGLMTLICADLR
jgi:hypothetical protein